MSDGMLDLLRTCDDAARLGGVQLLRLRDEFDFREKSRFDLVTDADFASQEAIERLVASRFPEHRFIGEEGPHRYDIKDDEYCWIVDPLDGTTNYVHGFPFYAVSVAVTKGSEILAGAVYDPVGDCCFRAVRNGGAWRDNIKLGTNRTQLLEQSLVAVSLPPQVGPDSQDLRSFSTIAQKSQGVRRTGSCAMNLAFVAAGRLDAFWAFSIHPWDVAAGVLLVREAGGTVTSVTGDNFNLWDAHFAAAANDVLHAELLPLLTR